MELSFHALMNTAVRKLRTAVIATVPILFQLFYKNDWESYRLLKIFHEAVVDAIIIKSAGLMVDRFGRLRGLRSFSYLIRNVREKDSKWLKPFEIIQTEISVESRR